MDSNIFREFREEVESSLGGTLVDVELQDPDYLKVFYRTKRKFKQHAHDNYRRLFLSIDALKDVVEYDLPADPTVDTIVKIIRPNNASTISAFDSADLFNVVAINDLFQAKSRIGGGSGVRFLEYEMVLGEVEKFKRYSAYDVDFRHDKFRNKLYVNRKPQSNETWLIDCSVSLTDEEYTQIDWFIRWAVTEAKIMLGMAYRKFQSVAGPTGETSLAGSEYIQEAKEEQRMLMEEIENLVSGSGDYYGITIG